MTTTIRHTRFLHILATTMLVLVGCEDDLPYDAVEYPPRLVMNAMLVATDEADDHIPASATDNRIYLRMSGPHAASDVDSGCVVVNVDGRDVCSIGGDGLAWREGIALGVPLRSGECVQLTARAGGAVARAVVTLPRPVAAVAVDTALARRSSQYGISFADLDGDGSCYRLAVDAMLSMSGTATVSGCTYDEASDTYIGWSYDTDTTVTTMQQLLLDNATDVILNDGDVAPRDATDDMLYTHYANTYSAFSDALFRDGTAHLSASVPTDLIRAYPSLLWISSGYVGRYYGSWTRDVLYVMHDSTAVQLATIVRLYTLSPADYRYYRSMNVRTSADYDEELSEPVVMPQNVIGLEGTQAIGYVGAAACRSFDIDHGTIATIDRGILW